MDYRKVNRVFVYKINKDKHLIYLYYMSIVFIPKILEN